VLRALRVGLAGHVQRERAQNQPGGGHRAIDDGVRGHAAAERMPTDPDRQRRPLRRSRVRRCNGLRRDFRRVDAVAAGDHVREIEAQGRDAAALERLRDGLHAFVAHASTGAVRKHERGHGVGRALPQHRRAR
jgi:hypothetical protein